MNKLIKLFIASLLLVSFSIGQELSDWKGWIANDPNAEVSDSEAQAVAELSDAFDGVTAAQADGLFNLAEGELTDAEVGNLVGDNHGATISAVAGVTSTNISTGLNITTITLADHVMVITDSEGSGGHGDLKIIDFPIGMIYVLSVVADMSNSAVTGMGATSAVDMALGSATVLTNAETLGNANVDFVAAVSEDLTAGVGVYDILTNTPQTEDGHTTSTDVWLCVAVEDSDMTATGNMTIDGTIVVTWVNTGDY